MRFLGLLMVLVWCAGCGGILSTMFKEQKWSENYALAPGTESTVPKIVDGNPETIGKLKLPRQARAGLGYTMIPTAEATITLSEPKQISKIIILSDRMDGVQVHAYDARRDDWSLIKEVKGNLPPRLEIRVSVNTNKIRIKSQAIPGRGSSSTFGRLFHAGPRDVVAPTIKEVEIYGFVEI